MPGPYLEAVEDQFDYETDWVEVAEDREQGGAVFADAQQEDTIFGYVPWNKRRSALRFFKGFSYPDTAAPWLLHREQPHQHPDYPWLRCASVNPRGVILRGNTANPNNSPYDTTPFVTAPVTRRTRWTHALLAVHYRAWGDVWFLEDGDIENPEDEWFRNTLFQSPEPSVEALTVTGGLSQLIFSEGGGTGPTAGTTRFGAPLAELQMKTAFRILWYHVDWDFLSSSNNFFMPDKILACVGRVNSDTFLDEFPPETLMMQPPQFELFPWWVASDEVTEPLIGVNVTLNFSHFDPTTGIDPPFRRGWNNMPWSGDGVADGDGNYYRATRSGANSGRGLLEAVPFGDIFTHVGS